MSAIQTFSELPDLASVKLRTQRPEPGRLWIRYSPTQWCRPSRPWTDVARAALGAYEDAPEETGSASTPQQPRLEAATLPKSRVLDDVVYVPPVLEALRGQRDDWVQALVAAGAPVVVHLWPGEKLGLNEEENTGETRRIEVSTADDASSMPERAVAVTREAGVLPLVDLLPLLLSDEPPDEWAPQVGQHLTPGSVVLWPLIAGVTDQPDLWVKAARALSENTAESPRLVPQVIELTPADRRALADQRPEAYDALFHRRLDASVERAFSTRVRMALAGSASPCPLPARPLPAGPPRLRRNRWLSGELIRIAELWLRLGRAVGRGDACFRAARWVDDSSLDVAALVKEGNLDIIEPIDAASRALLEELVQDGHNSLLDELLRQYLAPPEEP